MKKPLLLCLIVLLIHTSLAAAQEKTPAAAQVRTSAFETYAKWRTEFLGQRPGAIATPHYSVAAVTRRLDANSARIEFTVVGKLSGYTMEIQPVKFSSQQNQEMAGEASKTQLRGHAEESTVNPISDNEVVIPVESFANAIEVKWTPEGVAEGMSYTLLLPLEDTPSANVFGVLLSPPRKSMSAFEKIGFTALQGPCYFAVGRSARCPDPMVACCFGRCAYFNFVNCTVTCCTKCERPYSCDGILPP